MTDEKAAVLEVNEVFYRAFAKKDLEAMGKVWSQGTWALCIHPGRQALKGWSEIRNSWERIFRNTQALEIAIEIVNVEVQDSLAYVVLVENVVQVQGNRRTESKSMATNIWQKMAQKWYLVHHHGSPIMG